MKRVPFSGLILLAAILFNGCSQIDHSSCGGHKLKQRKGHEQKGGKASRRSHYNAHANPSENSSAKKKKYRPMLEAKVGYFFFTDSKMRKIYDQGGIDVQISGSYPIYRWLQIYGSVEYLERHGKSLHDHQRTSIWEIPLSVGLQPVIQITPKIQYYFTLGPRYFFVQQNNSSSYVRKEVNKNGLGGFVNMGFHFFPKEHFVVDLFGEYSYKQFHGHSSKKHVYGESAQVGGLTFGVGLGYAF